MLSNLIKTILYGVWQHTVSGDTLYQTLTVILAMAVCQSFLFCNFTSENEDTNVQKFK